MPLVDAGENAKREDERLRLALAGCLIPLMTLVMLGLMALGRLI